MTEQELRQAIVRILRTHLGDHTRIFLFGSRTVGQHTPRSDYDIGVEAEAPVPLEVMARLQGDLDDLPVLQKIEVVDLGRVSETFKQEALASAQAW